MLNASGLIILLYLFSFPYSVEAQDVHPTGIEGEVVYLNDLEDHSWSYYSDATCPIRSLNPADVTIIYYGNGQAENNMTTTDNADAPSTFGAKATGVKVGIASDEGQNTFVYYKTLERTDGATATSVASATGRCAYTTIPNPFQVRPTYGTDATKWRGFYKWRVKSVDGGTIYTTQNGTATVAAGGTIDAEQTVYFAPTASTGMQVEFEALWAQAYVTTSNANNYAISASVSYERNFRVITSTANLAPRQSANYQYTLTSVYPNGTSDGTNATTTKGSTTVRGTQSGYGYDATYPLTLSANTKFEYVAFNMGNSTLTAAGHNLIIGRGCTGTVNFVRGQSGNTTSAQSYTLRLESGTFNTFAAIDNTARTHSRMFSVRTIFGCDYDRATGNNSRLSIAPSGTVYGGNATQTFSSTSNRNNITYDWVIKSGKVQENVAVGDGAADKAIYMGNSSAATTTQYNGRRRITIEGGEMASIAGGVDCYDPDTYTNYGPDDGDDWKVRIRVKGGTIRGAIYGAAAYGGASYGRYIILTGGTINGWIAGGCNGIQDKGGELFGATNLYVGGNVRVVQSSSDPLIGGTTSYGTNGAYGGNIFGAGCGIQPSGYNASNPAASLNALTVGKVFGSTVVIADEAVVGRDVYGGGNFGLVADNTGAGWTNNTNMTARVYVLGGTVKGKVYGGSNNQQGQTVNITMKGGTVEGGLYGGSNSWGTINNNITMQIDGGQVGLGSGNVVSSKANIHGGGYGSGTSVGGTVSVTLGSSCTAEASATIYGDVYLGSAEGTIGSGLSQRHTITLKAGTIYGGLYGGGLGVEGKAADVKGNVAVRVMGGSVLTTSIDPDGEEGSGSVFGCNNVNGKPTGSVGVDIYGTNALHAVYGGGNRSAYSGTPRVIIHGCDNSIEYVYGGGNASDVAGTDVAIWGGTIGNAFGGGNGYSVEGNHSNPAADHYNPGANITSSNAHLAIHGGTITNVFGGSNQYGSINNKITIDIEPKRDTATNPCGGTAYDSCEMNLTNIYGGGNEAEIRHYVVGSTGDWLDQPTVNLPCDIKATSFFGGSKAANYGKDITLNVYYGEFDNVFGGNDQGGVISGNVTVNVYGGTIKNVFGGNNEGGNITGSIVVNINEQPDSNSCTAKSFDITNVYGGGYNAIYRPSDTTLAYPEVNIINGAVAGCVYGGGYGKGAKVSSWPKVTVGGKAGTAVIGVATIGQNVYGGGNEAPVVGYPNVILVGGTVGGSIFGGGRGKQGDIDAAKVKGDTLVLLKGGEVMGSVYGGGHLGQVDGSTQVVLE